MNRSAPKLTQSIGPAMHGILDYLMVIILIIGPGVAGFAASTAQAKFCWVIAALLLIVSILTRYPLGAKKVVGFVSHGVVEIVIGIVLVILPWTRDFARGVHSRNFFVCIGLLLLIIWTLTDFRNIRGPSSGPSLRSGPPSPR